MFRIGDPHFLPHFPVHIGTPTISPAVPNAENKPGAAGNDQRDQVPFSCPWKNPADAIKERPCRMKDKEENIQDFIHHTAYYEKSRSVPPGSCYLAKNQTAFY